MDEIARLIWPGQDISRTITGTEDDVQLQAEPEVCTCVEECTETLYETDCPLCSEDISLCKFKETVEVDLNFRWIDNGNNDGSRPAWENLKNCITITKTVGGVQTTGITLPADASYIDEGTGTSGARLTCRMPKYDKETGELASYVMVQDNNKLLQNFNYVFTKDDDNTITNIQGIDYIVNFEDLDGDDITSGAHPDFLGSLVTGNNTPIIITQYDKDGIPVKTVTEPYKAENQWTFNAAAGTGTYVIKHLPKYEDSDTAIEIDYRVTLDTTPKTMSGVDYNVLSTGGNDYSVTYDNTLVPNHGSDDKFVANGGKVSLVLRCETQYYATKFWLDGDRSELRQTAKFELWRYTDIPGASYKTASPVRYENSNIIKFTIDGTTQGRTTPLDVATDEGSAFQLNYPLEQYDARGYEYIYFLRESTSGGKANYETVFCGDVDFDSGEIEEEVLPEGITRTKGDESIYNFGGIANRIAEPVPVEGRKLWNVLAYVDTIGYVQVEFMLQSRIKADEGEPENPWTDTTVTMTKEGWDSVITSQDYIESMPKYNKIGKELEYRWVEKQVIDEDENNKLESDGTFTLILNEENSWDPSRVDIIGGWQIQRQNIENFESIEVYDPTAEMPTVVTNTLVGKVDYVVLKTWAAGTDPIPVNISIVGSDGSRRTITLDGTVDQGSMGYELGGRAREEHEWLAHFEDLPKYTEDGALILYKATEDTTGDFHSTISHNATDRVTTIHNGPGTGMVVPVEKRWVDDEDSACRYPSFINLYYNGPDVEGPVLITNTPIELSTDNAWYYEIGIPASFVGTKEEYPERWKRSNYYIEEVALKSLDSSDGYRVESTTQYGDVTYTNGTVTTDNHMYVVKTGYDGGIVYVSNRRVGTVDVIAYKEWNDKGADKAERPDAQFKLIVESDNAEIDGNKVVVDGVKTVTLDVEKNVAGETTVLEGNGPIIDVDKTVDAGVKVYYTFKGLPKYDAEGKVIDYSITEEWVNPADAASKDYSNPTNSEYISNNRQPITTHVQAQSEEEHDLIKINTTNTRSAAYDVNFYKEWDDNYAYKLGNRPDIYVNLYKTNQLDDDGNAPEGTTVTPEAYGFKVNSWSPDARRSNNRRYWMVTFENVPKYDANGQKITYYASELTNGNYSQFDYKDTTFKDGSLSEVTLEDPNTWVETASDGQVVLKEDGTFVNKIENKVTIKGQKLWVNIPVGFTGNLPTIDVNLLNKAGTEGTETQVVDDDNNDVRLDEVETETGKRSIKFDFYYEEGGTKTNTHYNYSPPKYDDDGEYYYYKFDEDINGTTVDGIPLSELYEIIDQGNYVLSNIYNEKVYTGQIKITKTWDRGTIAGPDDVYPDTTFELHRVYLNSDPSVAYTDNIID
ncbi:MAG: Cna B-type domain-containing protein, partial [Parasporobacterium sp.]|nr:Cna B-type domain-containing protein [Parasporobacterium sp.]